MYFDILYLDVLTFYFLQEFVFDSIKKNKNIIREQRVFASYLC